MFLLGRKLGEILVSAGVITEEQLNHALTVQKTRKRPLGELLCELGFATSDEIAKALAEQTGMRMLEPGQLVPDEEAISALPPGFCQGYKVLPVRDSQGKLLLAMSDPTNLTALDLARERLGVHIEPALADHGVLMNVLADQFGTQDMIESLVKQLGTRKDFRFLNTQAENFVIEGLESPSAPTVKIVSTIIAEAIDSRASDIHIEPREEGVQVRYRVDGVLRDAMLLPSYTHTAVITRIKVMAEMDITERRLPQDGHMKIRYRDRTIDIRVSTLPTAFGEKAVLRILDHVGGVTTLEEAGFLEDARETIERALRQPQGCILVTGPTGSGKTTTLYTCLMMVRSARSNIVTIEDPIERYLPGINQVQVLEAAGMTFAAGLRSILRQDPDVVMVGEIRDAETAQVAMRAALTGHLVLSTLHTNDAVSTITRLVDIGIDSYLIASSLSLVIAQRLVRRNCEECREPYKPSEAALARVEEYTGKCLEGEFCRGKGCVVCDETGFSGRTVVYELLVVSDRIREMINAGATEEELLEAAREEGMVSMFDVGLRKALAGETTLEEVLQHVPAPRKAKRAPAQPEAAAVVVGETPAPAETKPEPQAKPQPPRDIRRAPQRSLRVLVVDDDKVSRVLMERILGNAGMDVVAVSSAEEALREIDNGRFDAVVTDIMMPGMDGIEFINRLRDDPRTAKLPIMVCSAVADRESVTSAIHTGVNDYMVKPIDGAMLVEKLRRMVSKARLAVDDVKSALQRLQLEGDPEFYKAVLDDFVEEIKSDLRELSEAVASGDKQTVDVVAARLKGGAANLGAQGITAVAEELARAATNDDFDAARRWLTDLQDLLVELERFKEELAASPAQ